MTLIYTKKAFLELIWEPFLNTDNMRETFKDDEDYVWIDDICRGDFCDFLISVREEWKEDYPRKALRFIIEPYAPTCIYVGIYEEKDPFSNFMYEYFQNYARYDLLKYYTDLERN